MQKVKEKVIVNNLREIKEIFDKRGISCWLDWGSLLGAIRESRVIPWDHEVDLGVMEQEFKKIKEILPEIERRNFVIKKAPISAPEITFRRDGYGVDIWKYCSSGEDFLIAAYYPLSSKPIAHMLWLLWRIFSSGYGSDDLPKSGIKLAITRCIQVVFFLMPHSIKRIVVERLRKTLVKNNHILHKHASVPKHFFENFKTIEFYDMIFDVPAEAERYLEYKYGKNWRTPIKDWNFNNDGAVEYAAKYNDKEHD